MLRDLFQSALTMGKILLKSKINLPSYTAPEKSVVVIANGPSARSFIDKCTSVGIENLKKQGLAFFAVDVLLFEVAVVAEGYVVRCANVDCKLIRVLTALNLSGVH